MKHIQKPSDWDAALIAASSLAYNFHKHIGNGIFAIFFRSTVEKIGLEIARQILDLKQPSRKDDPNV